MTAGPRTSAPQERPQATCPQCGGFRFSAQTLCRRCTAALPEAQSAASSTVAHQTTDSPRPRHAAPIEASPAPGIPNAWDAQAAPTQFSAWAQQPPYAGAPIRATVPPARRRHAWWIAAAAVVAVSAGVFSLRAGVFTHDAGSARSTPAPESATPAQLGDTLTQIAVHATDMPKGVSVKLDTGGDQVAGHVTLDNCGYNFTTEAHRVARRQYNVVDATSAVVLWSNEVVAYDTPAHAAQALTEWHTAAATCPRKPVSVSGQPGVLTKITRNQLDVGGLPAVDNALTMETATIPGPHTLYLVAILQVHGRYLDAVSLEDNRPITTQLVQATAGLAILTGRRLIAQN